eukprot:Rhum_TRINITY_DN15131_c2_g1::Rhum_TRINITY_DN15131_c2_g1_i1::g.139576::m.139576
MSSDDGETSIQSKIDAARNIANQAAKAGVSEGEEKALQKWLQKIEDVDAAVKYVLSDDYKPDKEAEEATPTPVPAAASAAPAAEDEPWKKQRYSSDYSRFDNEQFVKEQPKKSKKAAAEAAAAAAAALPAVEPDRANTKEFCEYIMKKESLAFKDKGNAAIKAGNYAEAEEQYSNGIGLDAACWVLRNNRAQARLKLGKWAGCVDDCNFVLRADKDPRNMKATKRRASALLRLRRSAEAIADIELATKHEGASKELRLMLAAARHEVAFETLVADEDPAVLAEVDAAVEGLRTAMRRSQQAGPLPAAEEAAAAAAAAGGEAGAEDAASSLRSRLKATADVLRRGGAAVKIQFNWSGGIALVAGYLAEHKAAILKELAEATDAAADAGALVAAALRGPTSWDLLATQLYAVLSEAYGCGYNLPAEGDTDAALDAVLELAVASFAAEKLCCFSALHLCVAVTEGEAGRARIARHLTVEKLMRLPHHTESGDDGTLALLLSLVDNLLKSPDWGDRLAEQPLPYYILPLMGGQRSRTVRDSAAAAVMRLTTDARFRRFLTSSSLTLPVPPTAWGALGSAGAVQSQSTLHYLSTYLQEEARTMASPFAVEAILASLQNCFVDAASATEAKEVAYALATTQNVSTCWELLSREGTPVNIQARALGLVSKCVSMPEVHGLLKDPEKRCVERLVAFADQSTRARAAAAPAATPAAAASAADDAMYEEQRQENAVSILAALVSREDQLLGASGADASTMCEVTEETERIFAGEAVADTLLKTAGVARLLLRCLEGTDRTCGNAALVFSVLVKDERWVRQVDRDVDGGLVKPLLAVIKKKRAEQNDEIQHRQTVREDKGAAAAAKEVPLTFSLNIQAQKNAAIALARLAKDPSNLIQLRENQGIEILSTTLKYVNDPKTLAGGGRGVGRTPGAADAGAPLTIAG